MCMLSQGGRGCVVGPSEGPAPAFYHLLLGVVHCAWCTQGWPPVAGRSVLGRERGPVDEKARGTALQAYHAQPFPVLTLCHLTWRLGPGQSGVPTELSTAPRRVSGCRPTSLDSGSWTAQKRPAAGRCYDAGGSVGCGPQGTAGTSPHLSAPPLPDATTVTQPSAHPDQAQLSAVPSTW